MCGSLRLFCDIYRVGSHIGDETDRLALAQVHAFVQLLGVTHGGRRRKMQLTVRKLLHGAGGKRRLRRTLTARLHNIGHHKISGTGKSGGGGFGNNLIIQFAIRPVDLQQFCGEFRLAGI